MAQRVIACADAKAHDAEIVSELVLAVERGSVTELGGCALGGGLG